MNRGVCTPARQQHNGWAHLQWGAEVARRAAAAECAARLRASAAEQLHLLVGGQCLDKHPAHASMYVHQLS